MYVPSSLSVSCVWADILLTFSGGHGDGSSISKIQSSYRIQDLYGANAS